MALALATELGGLGPEPILRMSAQIAIYALVTDLAPLFLSHWEWLPSPLAELKLT